MPDDLIKIRFQRSPKPFERFQSLYPSYTDTYLNLKLKDSRGTLELSLPVLSLQKRPSALGLLSPGENRLLERFCQALETNWQAGKSLCEELAGDEDLHYVKPAKMSGLSLVRGAYGFEGLFQVSFPTGGRNLASFGSSFMMPYVYSWQKTAKKFDFGPE